MPSLWWGNKAVDTEELLLYRTSCCLPWAGKKTWLSLHPSLSTGRLHPRLPPSSQLPQWGVLESKEKTPCNVKISDCLPPVTEDTHLCSRKLEIRKIFPCFLQHIFAQSLISLLIFGVFFFPVIFFLNFFLCSFFCLLCQSVAGLFWSDIFNFPAC